MSVTPKQWEAATKKARAETAARQLFEARAHARSNEAAPALAPAQESVPLSLAQREDRARSNAPAPAQEIAPLHEARARSTAPAPAQEIAPLHEARGRNNAPAPAQEFASLHEARARNNAPAPAQRSAPLHEARAPNNAPSSAQEIAPLKKTLSLSLLLSLPLNKPHTQNLVGADGSKDADNTMAAATQEDADSTVAAIAREDADDAVMAVYVVSRAQCTIARHQRKTSTRTATRIIIGNKRFGNYHMAAGDLAASER